MSTAKIIIKAQDQTKQGINSAKSNLKELNDLTSSLGINLKSLTSVTAVGLGLKALADGAKKCCETFLETESTYLTLKTALKDTKSYDTAINSINKLSKTTLSSREDVAKLYTTLVQLGKSEENINKIIEASISLANVTGKSLTESFNVMLDSLDGSTGTLQKYLPEVKNLTKEELALGKAIDLTNEAFSETAKSISTESYSQQIKNIKDDVTTIAEDIGYILMESLSPVFEWIQESLDSFKDTVDEWRSNVEKKSSVLGLRDSAKKNSASYYVYQGYLDNRTSKGGILTGTSIYTLKGFDDTIVDATSALEAYATVMEMAEAGLLSVEDSYAKEVLERCRNIDTTVDLQYEELKKQTKATTTAKSNNSTSSSGDTSLWLSEATREASLTLFTGRFADYFKTDFKQAGAMIAEGMQGYEVNDTSRAKKLIDYANQTFERNVKVSFLDEFTEILKSGGDVLFSRETEAQIDDLTNSFVENWKTENEKILSEYQELCSEVLADVDKSLSTYASTYLSESSYEGYNDYLKAELLKEVQQLVREAELASSDGDPRVAYLKEIANNLENGIIPNLDPDSTISSGSKYLSEDTKRALEIAYLRKDISDTTQLLSDMKKNQEVGFELYSELDFTALEEILAGMMSALTDLVNYIPTTSSASDRANSYISANSNYLSEEKQNEKLIEKAKEDIKKTEEEINILYQSRDFHDKELQELLDIRNGQIKELDALKNATTEISGSFDWGVFGDVLKSTFGENGAFSSASVDAGIISDFSNALSGIIDALGSFGSIILSSNPLLATVLVIITKCLEALAPMVETLVGPLNEALTEIGTVLAEIFLPLFDALYPWIVRIAEVIKGFLIPIIEAVGIAFDVVALVVQVLSPIMLTVAKALTILAAPIQWLADLISWLGDWLVWFGECIGIALYNVLHPFTKKSYSENPGGFSSDAFTGLTDRLEQIDAIGTITNGVSGNYDSDTTSTSVRTATYTGANNYYFNIYQQAPVVGDGGMQEFAKIIKKEFAELAYMGA